MQLDTQPPEGLYNAAHIETRAYPSFDKKHLVLAHEFIIQAENPDDNYKVFAHSILHLGRLKITHVQDTDDPHISHTVAAFAKNPEVQAAQNKP